MKALIRVALVGALATPAWADTSVSQMPEHIGFGSGALLGAAIAGPVGVVVGGTLGALMGHDVVNDQVIASKTEALTALEIEVAEARNALAEVQAETAKAEAELAAFKTLMADLSLSVHFETDSAMTAESYRQALEALAKASQQIDGMTVSLVGHADARGSATHNHALSKARADSVSAVLAAAGAPKDVLHTEARGEADAGEDGACGFHALDRRVDLQVRFSEDAANAGLYTLRQ